MKLKKLLLITAVIFSIMLFCGITASAATEVASGTCGTDLTWVLDSDGVLTISGTGDMEDYTSNTSNSEAPWCSNRSSIKAVTIGENVTSIGNYAFSNCSSLTSITIPENVTYIDEYAFYNCTGLTEIIWNAKNVADFSSSNYVFYKAGQSGDGINVVFGDSVETIPAYVFYPYSNSSYSPNITSVTIGEKVTSIGDYAFAYCSSMTSTYITDLSAWCKISFGTVSSNPLRYATFLYVNNEKVTNVIIPNDVTSIGKYAFYNYVNLTGVTIPENVTYIDEYAFYNCTGLTEIIWNAKNVADFSSSNYVFYKAGQSGDGINVVFGDSVETIPAYVFYPYSNSSYSPNITSVTIGEKVTSIGSYAFIHCTGLTSVTIGENVTSISNHAFYSCTGLTSITIPDSVISVDTYAFGCCSGLTSVTIGENVTVIEFGAFYGCSGLTSMVIPESVTNIGEAAFSGCSNLISINIPNGITSIARWTFKECSNITNIIIPNGVKSIRDYAFASCTKLSTITIPGSVTSIGDYAFNGCSSLSNVYYMGNSRKWSNISFVNKNTNTPLLNATIYYNYDYETNTYKGTCGENITWILDSDGNMKLSGSGSMPTFDSRHVVPWSDSVALIKNVVIGDGITSIEAFSFRDCVNLSSIAIPDSVVSIGNYAFCDCTSLSTVYYSGSSFNWSDISFGTYNEPLNNVSMYYNYDYETKTYKGTCGDNITWTIDNEGNMNIVGSGVMWEFYDSYEVPWYDNRSLIKNVVISDGVTSIGNYVFLSCSNLTNITIPESIISIGDEAFYGCYNIKSINIPDSVTSIGNYAFYGCSKMTSVTIGKNVTNIGEFAFKNCSSLTSVYITDLSAWCKIAFDNTNNPLQYKASLYLNNEKVTNLVIPNNITSINDYAFYNCSSLTSITIHNGIKGIGSYAFYGCTNITSISIGEGVTYIGDYAFYNCTGLTEINWNAKNVADFSSSNYVFYKAGQSGTGINVVFGDTVEKIPAYVFYPYSSYSPKITNVTMGEKVTSIGNYAFYYCGSIKSINIPDSVTNIGSYAFYNCTGLTSVAIGENVTNIGNYAFSNCSSLMSVYITDLSAWCKIAFGNTSSNPLNYGASLYLDSERITNLVIPDDIISINNYAFYNCKSINNLTISDNAINIGSYAFYGCSNIESVTMSKNITSISNYAFSGCSDLTSIYITDLSAWCKIAFSNYTSNPLYYGDLYINQEKVTNVIIPDDVTSIGKYAFSYYDNLTSVTISENVTYIDEYAFYNCTGLTEIIWNAKNVADFSSSNYVFYKAGQSGDGINVIFGDSVETIPAYVFYPYGNSSYSPNITSVTIGEKVTSIGSYAFYYCSNIENVYYYGDENDWNKITIGSYNTYLTNVVRTYECCYIFEANGGSEVEQIITFYGIETEPITTNGNKTFAGWYKTADFSGERVTFPYTSSKDITLYAKWIYYINYEGDYNKTDEVTAGAEATLPTPDYGWYYEFTLNDEPWDGTNITENVTVNVKAVRNTYTVTYAGDYTGTDSALYEADVTLPIPPDYGWYYEFTLNDESWDGTNITENVTVNVKAVRNTYTVTYEGDYTGTDSVAYEADVTLPIPPDYGWYYEFTLNDEPWDGTNITENVTVNVKALRNTYTVTYAGDYTGTDSALYEADVTLPAPPEGFVYVFKVNNTVWDGENITEDITVTVTKLNDTAEFNIKNLEEISVDSNSVSGVYYGQSYIPEIEVTNNATYELYTDIECTNQVTAYTLSRGINTVYIKVICESGRSEIYTISINRNIPEELGTLSLPQAVGANFTFKVENKITGNPVVKVLYGSDANDLSNERVAEFDATAQTIYVADLPENSLLNFKVIAIYDEITVESTIFQTITGENLSSECDLISMVYPAGGTIVDDTVDGLRVTNKIDTITIDAVVSEDATWELHSKKLQDSVIADKTITLNEGTNRTYIKVFAEDGKASKTYTVKIYRQTKSVAPVINVENGSATITMPNSETATIIYTLDGSMPSETNGNTYDAPFGVRSGETINVIAIQADKDEVSDVVTYNVPAALQVDIAVDSADVVNNKCVFDFWIESSMATEGKLIVAIYNENNKLIGIKTTDADLSEGFLELTSFEVDFVGTPHKYKVMLWDSMEDLRPMCESISDNF